ncbi:hypothetical protein [Dyella sp. C9]|uniref:hypothetical protein n=1 Tax=Dyella sp. C9 TaxID=2202154 RepID=UPI0013009D4A|nr:hypothetical protein [Dyella sp. C9]
MDKSTLLKDKAVALRVILNDMPDDADAAMLLRLLKPLFDDIASGKVIPPYPYAFKTALGKDALFYERHPNAFSAEAAFISALEDWPSKPWYQSLVAGPK